MAKMEPTVNVNSISRISAGTVIKGEIQSPYDIRIDGTFEGKVQTKGRVVVGESADVKGDVICENIDLWGKRRLAYLVNDKPEGYYVLMNFESKPEFPAEMERVMKITEGVLRCLTTVVEA